MEAAYVIAAAVFLVLMGACGAVAASYGTNMIDEINQRLGESERLPYEGFSLRRLEAFLKYGHFWTMHRKLCPQSRTRRIWSFFTALQMLFFAGFLLAVVKAIASR